MKLFISICISLILLSCNSTKKNDATLTIDSNSYNLGIIGGFSELVNSGVKKLALSEVFTPEEMDLVITEVEKIAKRNHVQVYREADLIKTNLFPEDIAVGKEVFLIYQGNTKDEYLALKEEVKKLEKEGKYNGEAKMEISRKFGALLSYPPYRINELLAENTSFRTMRDFGIKASNLFLYYKNIEEANNFYENILGMTLVADYKLAKIFRITNQSYLILVDEKYGMHKITEPKTLKLSLITDQLKEWNTHLKEQKIKFNNELISDKSSETFSIFDPSGYTIEFISYKNNIENDAILNKTKVCNTLFGNNKTLGIKSSITWMYFKDLQNIENFYAEKIGLKKIADNSISKIYEISPSGYIGLMDDKHGLPYTESKAANIAFILNDIEGWFNYCNNYKSFEVRSKEIEVGDEGKYKAFVGYCPENYYLEFDAFFEHQLNTKLMEGLKE